MPISEELLEYYYSQHNKYSIRTSWHQQHIIENILDLQGFIASISETLEPERRDPDSYSYPLGFFQVEQPSRIRYSQVIFLFTILERRVRALVNLTIELKPEIKNDLSDYKGAFIERVRKFFQEHIDLDLATTKEWNEIIIYQKIRDCIIHCGGRITESRDQQFLNTLVEKKQISVNTGDYMLLTDELCQSMESSVLDFVFTGLDKLYEILVKLETSKNSA